MNFSNNPKRALMLIMGAFVLVAFGTAQLYYKHQDKGIDPRIVKARELYSKYNDYAQNNEFSKILNLLDSIEIIYSSIPHYINSYEVGVLYNNRAAAYISMAIYFDENSISLDGVNTLTKDSLINLGANAANYSIGNYSQWLSQFKNLNKTQIIEALKGDFLNGLSAYNEKQQKHFINSRTKEILEAQYETPRRLSVAYTNLGIINRHNENYEEAVANYKKAIKLWNRNLAAENNLNILLGLPVKKQRLIDKILPPDKNKHTK